LPDVPLPKVSDLKRFDKFPLTKGKRRKVELYCFFVEPENAECGKGLENMA